MWHFIPVRIVIAIACSHSRQTPPVLWVTGKTVKTAVTLSPKILLWVLS